jgi:glycosyltransferase involved in cell wall biosynthesis
MIVGIDALAWGTTRGYGRHLRELVRSLVTLESPHRYRLVVVAGAAPDLPAGPNVTIVEVARASGHGLSALSELRRAWRLSRLWSDRSLDLMFFPSPLTFVPSLPARPTVVVVHDAIAHQFPRLVFESAYQARAWRVKVRLAVRQATRVVTVSEHARQSVARHLNLDSKALRVVGEAPAMAFRAPADPVASGKALERLGVAPGLPIVIAHGALAPHKNLGALIDVCHRLASTQCTGLVLLLVGQPASAVEADCLERKARAGPARVLLTGAIADDSLVALLHAATVAVLPSLDEGLGLSGLEAAACGTPLLATSSSAMPELLGDAALYFNPANSQSMEDGLARLLSDSALREALGARGAERARALTWRRAASDLLAIFDEIDTSAARRDAHQGLMR